jgi:ABC-2 type transport system permease protein
LNKTLTSLLAAPLGIRELFLGKIAAVFLATYALVLLALAISGAAVWFRFGKLPSAPTILAALVTVPIWGIVFSELLGLVYILFGNPFILRLLMIFVMVVILNFGSAGELNVLVLSPAVLIPTGIGVAVLLFFFLERLDKERVART